MNWKKLGKITGLTVGGLFVAVTAVGFALPRKMHVARSVTIDAKATEVYPLIANFKDGWSLWNPFGPKKYRDLKMEYSGPAEGVGAKQAWASPDSGDGHMRIMKADPQRGVEMELSMMQESFKGTDSLLCEPAGRGTKVTWTDEFDLGNNPYNRYLPLFFSGSISDSFDEGLASLKKETEARAAQARR